MTSGLDAELIDRIYEAAVLPELWPGVFDGLGEVAGCDKVGMFALSAASRLVVAWASNERCAAAAHAFLTGGWMARSTQAARMFALGEPRFVSDLEVFTREELEADPYYQEFLRPNGLFWGAGTFIDGPADNKVIVTIHRPYERGPLDLAAVRALTALRPHIARAAFLSARLRLERLSGAVRVLAALGLPAAALSERGKLLLANDLFQALIPSLFLDRTDRLRLADQAADRLLGEAIAARTALPARGRTLAIRSEEGTAAFIVHLVPVAGHSRDLFSGTDWLIAALPVDAAAGVRPGVLEGLFDLTPAEARVARDLAGGRDIAAIAAGAGLSRETVRSQLRGVFRKTGVRRQADLVRLLCAIAVGRKA